jgi:hypothetical protein
MEFLDVIPVIGVNKSDLRNNCLVYLPQNRAQPKRKVIFFLKNSFS